MPDLVQRAVGTGAVEHRGDHILVGVGRSLERREALRDQGVVPPRAHRGHPRLLAPLRVVGDLEDVDRGLVVFGEPVHADHRLVVGLDLGLEARRTRRDLPLEPARLDPGHHAPLRLDLGEEPFGLALEPIGQCLDEIGTAEGVLHVGHAGLVGEDLLGAQRDADRVLGRERQRLVEGVGVERLRAAQHRRQRLVGHPHDVVVRLLCGERHPGGLGVEAHLPAAVILGAILVAEPAGPDAAGGAKFGDLLEEIVVDVPEEGEPRPEAVDCESAREAVFDVAEAIGQGEGELLRRRRPGFADVVAADGDGIPLGGVGAPPLEHVHDELERRLHREDPGVLGHVFLEDVVLDGALQLGRGHPLLLGRGDEEAPEDRGGAVDRHRHRDLIERDPGEEGLHVGQRADRDAALPHLTLGTGMVGVVPHQGREVEGHRQAGLSARQEELVALVGVLGGTEAGELPHRPELAAVPGGVDPAGVGELPREFRGRERVERGVDRLELEPRDGAEVGVSAERLLGVEGAPLRDLGAEQCELALLRGEAFIRVGGGHPSPPMVRRERPGAGGRALPRPPRTGSPGPPRCRPAARRSAVRCRSLP